MLQNLMLIVHQRRALWVILAVLYLMSTGGAAFITPLSKMSPTPRISSVLTRTSLTLDDEGKASDYTNSAADDSEKENDSSVIRRPFHQHWWPVTVSSAIDKARPNAIELLGMRLVLFYDSEEGQWNCLEDMCQHRFAPLSEGRIVTSTEKDCSVKTCIQCSYHGWEFDSQGSCSRIPQQQNDQRGKVPPVRRFPAQLDAGIIWVWADPDTKAFSDATPLPISPLLRRWHEHFGDNSAFMRDLPYGMELLGENLLDLSHLPYSHHALGSLNREDGGPLPLRMLTKKEKMNRAEWETDYAKHGYGTTGYLPEFQVEVVNATSYDPIFVSTKRSGFADVSDNATCTISYYEPCHARYRRVQPGISAQHVELFMVPTNAGQSRVILYNANNSSLPPLEESVKEKQVALKSFVGGMSPAALKKKIMKKVFAKLFDPTSCRMHLFSHQIFDGDGIFLNKQGDRMRRRGLTYKDYSTPTSADLMVNAYRRYLNKVAMITKEAGQDNAANVVVSRVGTDNGDFYIDTNDRPKLLDRYESHTKNCPVCSKNLEKSQRSYKRWNVIQTAFVGTAGSCYAIFTMAATVSFLGASVASVLIPTSAAASVSTTLGAAMAGRQKKKLDAKIQSFIFEDHIHADKN
jgi:phenylpropionate dioxygenase-like ring-hydroxylating dioxygenase large terminal subunit